MRHATCPRLSLPLEYQGGWNDYEHVPCISIKKELTDEQSSLDRLAEADLVCE